MIALRAGRTGDRDALYGIWERAVRATHDFVTPADFAMYARLVRNYYLPQTPVTVAVDERDVPLGFIGVMDNRIEALFVAPERHGEGIGRLLVENALARRHESREDLLVDVNEQNTGGRRFYDRMGFRVTGRSALDGCGRPYPILHLIYAE
jgi:putative acetyltransferase